MAGRARTAARRLGAAVAVAAVVGAGGVAAATTATAAPSCPAGKVCTWSGLNGGGVRTSAEFARNYTTTIASVFPNYQSVSVSFWTGVNGGGERITGYTTSQRGFRNWSASNHNRCKSHVDRLW